MTSLAQGAIGGGLAGIAGALCDSQLGSSAFGNQGNIFVASFFGAEKW